MTFGPCYLREIAAFQVLEGRCEKADSHSLMNQELGPLLVEVYLEGAHILGVCRQVQERKRLIDVLNHQDSILEIEQARVTFGIDGEPRIYESLSISKSAILAAVPRET